MKNINSKTALNNALTSVGISDGNYCCEYICLESGYYRMIVSTLMLRYELTPAPARSAASIPSLSLT